MNFQIKWFLVTNFRQRIVWRVTIVLEKESWGIRISLNTMISIQVFNETLLISSCLSSKKITRINFLKYFVKCHFGEGTQLPMTDSLTSYSCSRKRNLEVWLVILNVLIVFEMFNTTDLWKFHVFSTTSENFRDN